MKTRNSEPVYDVRREFAYTLVLRQMDTDRAQSVKNEKLRRSVIELTRLIWELRSMSMPLAVVALYAGTMVSAMLIFAIFQFYPTDTEYIHFFDPLWSLLQMQPDGVRNVSGYALVTGLVFFIPTSTGLYLVLKTQIKPRIDLERRRLCTEIKHLSSNEEVVSALREVNYDLFYEAQELF